MEEILKEFISSPTWIGLLVLSLLGLFFLASKIIDFYQSIIAPNIYKWRLEQKKIIIPSIEKFLDIANKQPELFRNTGPKFIDFKKGYVFQRKELSLIENILSKGRFVHIEGAPSSGKTVLTWNYAVKQLNKYKQIVYFDRPNSISQGFIEFISTPFGLTRIDNSRTLIIIDDVHLDTTSTSNFFWNIYNNLSQVKILFISRPINLIQIDEELSQFIFTNYMETVEVSANHAMTEMVDYFSEKIYKQKISKVARNSFVNECGNDLLILGRYLKAWNGDRNINFSELRIKVIESIFQDIESLQKVNNDAVKVLFVVGLFYRFEVRVEKSFLQDTLGLNVNPLINNGALRMENDFIFFYHSSIAKLYSNAIKTKNHKDYTELLNKHKPFPVGLFKLYIQSNPRNFCELVIGIRKSPDVLKTLFNEKELIPHIVTGLENEQSLNLAGWTLQILNSLDKHKLWDLLKIVRFRNSESDILIQTNANDISLFIHNLYIISLTKGEEWLSSTSTRIMSDKLFSLPLKRLTRTLNKLKKISNKRFEEIINISDLNILCEKIYNEDNIQEIRYSIYIFGRILGERIYVKSHSKKDFTGEYTTVLAFYCEKYKVTKYLSGRGHNIPFSHSNLQRQRHWIWLAKNKCLNGFIVIDDGAVLALRQRNSLFPVGVKSVTGKFNAGDIVEIRNMNNKTIGLGIMNFSSKELNEIKGLRSDEILDMKNISSNRVCDNDRLIRPQKIEMINKYVTNPATNKDV